MKKKIAIIILTIAVFATSIVSSVFAAVKDDKPVSSTQTVNSVGSVVEEGITTDGWEYKVYSDGTASISGYKGTETTATFPKTINGHKITYLAPYMLDNSIIEKLIIPDATPFAKEIYTDHCLDNCFRLATNLKEVVIGSMFARELPYCMFHSCKKLERVTFTEKFTEVASTIYTPADEFNIERTGCYINEFAFGYCPELHNIVIPEGVTRVSINAFSGSENIDTIVAPTSLVSINNSDGDPDGETRCPAPFGVKRLIILGTKTKTSRYKNIEIIGPKNSYIEEQQINTGEFELIDITTIDVQKIIDEINGVEPVTETTTTTTTTSTTTNTTKSTSTSTPASTKPSTTTTTVPVSTRPSTTKVPATKVPTTTAPKKTNTPTTKYAGSFSTTLYVARSINNYRMNGKGISYMSKNPKIATVDKNGKITAKSKGRATIVIKNNTTKTYTHIIVTVKKPTINKTNLTLKTNKKFKLKITGQVGKAKFLTNNKSVAKVSKTGVITAKKKGKATITIKTNGLTLKCKVTVK